MHRPVEAGFALDQDLAQQRTPLAANVHCALLTVALTHVQHTLHCTGAPGSQEQHKLTPLHPFRALDAR